MKKFRPMHRLRRLIYKAMDSGVVLNRERRGLRISVRSLLTGLEIKERLNLAEKTGGFLYIPEEVIKESEGYCVYIRHRTSVKMYLSEAVPDIRLISILLEGFCGLWELCEENRISFYHFLFDYDAVFISGVMERVEFVYLPGASINRNNNSIRDMFTILLLHAEESDCFCRDLIAEALFHLEQWEKDGGAFPAEVLRDLLPVRRGARWWSVIKIPGLPLRSFFDRRQKDRRGEKRAGAHRIWQERRGQRFLLWNFMIFLLAAGFLVWCRNLLIWPFWFAISAIGELCLMPTPGRGALTVIWTLFLSGTALPGKEEITVGRDKIWADLPINDACVSRRHAVIFQNKRSLTVRDLFSSNGTYVDGQPVAAGEEVNVHAGQIISFGETTQFSVKFRPRILFSNMVK